MFLFKNQQCYTMLQLSILVPFLVERRVVESSGHNSGTMVGRVGPHTTGMANQMTANDGGCFSIVHDTAELSHTLVCGKERRTMKTGAKMVTLCLHN